MLHARADSLLNAENRLASLQRVKSAAPGTQKWTTNCIDSVPEYSRMHPQSAAADASSALKPADQAALKPRRALGDITNKNGKDASAQQGKGDAQKAAPRIEVVRCARSRDTPLEWCAP